MTDDKCENCDCACDDVYVESVGVSKKVPDAEFEVYQNNDTKKIKLSDYKGKWLILFFYPKDFTFVCPTELEDMAENYDAFQKENAEVISVSTDTIPVHKAWHDISKAVGKVQFPMGADPTGKLTRMMGVHLEDEGVALRGSFIISPDGVLRIAEVNDDGIGRSAKELLRKLRAARFVEEHGGQVCPANWEPGDDTLEPGLDLVGKI